MVTAPATQEQRLVSGAGAITAAHEVAVSNVPNAISHAALEELHAKARLNPQQRLSELHKQQINLEADAMNGKILATNIFGTGGSMVASHVTEQALKKGVEAGSTKALEQVASKAGLVGQAVCVGVSAVGGNLEAKQRLQQLVGDHMEEIQKEFHIKPEEMTDAHLRRLAEMPGYEQLQKEIKILDQKMSRAVVGATAGALGWAAVPAVGVLLGGAALTATGVGAVVGVPTIVAGIGLFAASMATSTVASAVADKAVTAITGLDPNDSPYKQLEKLKEKLQSDPPQPIDQIDVFKALLAGDKDLQEAVSKQTGGKKFEDIGKEGVVEDPNKMKAAQTEFLQRHHAKLLDASKQLAYQINCGDTLPTRLISISTLALASDGAKAAYELTRGDLMRGTGENILQTQEPIVANKIVPFGKPTYTISTEGAVNSTLQPRARGIDGQLAGAQQAGVTARQAQEAAYSQQI